MIRSRIAGLRLCPLFALAGILFLAHEPASGADAPQNWAQWRGPLGTGAAPDAKPPVKWGDSQNIKWKVKVPGVGSSTPIIWGDKVFIQTAIDTGKAAAGSADQPAPQPRPEPRPGPGPGRPGGRRPGGGGGFGGGSAPTTSHQFALLCLDRNTGKTLWQKTLREEKPHEGHHRDHGFASHSPVTDGQVIVSFFGSRGLHCLDMDGNVKWSKDLGKQQTRAGFGEGSSPALHGNTIVVLWDHEGADFIAAFDKETGKELWRQQRNEQTTWTTPVIVEHEGKPQVIAAATNKVRSYDLATGKQLWEVGPLTDNVIPTPVYADGVLYAMSGFRGAALFAVKLGGSGDIAGSDAVVWKASKGTPYVPSPLLYQGRLYFFSGNNALLSVLDAASGKTIVETARLEEMQNVYASPVAADGRIYLTARNGVVQVIKAGGDKVEVLATNTLNDRLDASPAIVGKQLFLRGQEHVYCIEE